MRQTILPWYGAVPGDASVCITKHVPYFVSIVSPTIGSRGNSTSSKSSQVGAWIVILNRLMGHMMQDGNLRGIRHPSCSNSSRACPERPQPPEPSSLARLLVRRSEDNCARHQATYQRPSLARPGRSVATATPPRTCAPSRKLAPQVESCSPRLLRLARGARREIAGFRPGSWLQGQSRHPSASTSIKCQSQLNSPRGLRQRVPGDARVHRSRRSGFERACLPPAVPGRRRRAHSIGLARSARQAGQLCHECRRSSRRVHSMFTRNPTASGAGQESVWRRLSAPERWGPFQEREPSRRARTPLEAPGAATSAPVQVPAA
jgi:hypothetical protein